MVFLAPLALSTLLLADGLTEVKPEACPGYEENVPGEVLLQGGLAEAGATKRRVIVVFGANYCQWCKAMCEAFENPQVATEIARDYVVVKIDVGGHGDRNPDLQKRYGIQGLGIPQVVIATPDGKGLTTASGAPFVEHAPQPKYAPELVLDFLRAWAPPPAAP